MLLCSDLMFFLRSRSPTKGHPTSPFIDEGKEQVIEKEKEKNKREKKVSRAVGSFFSFMRVPPTL